MENLKTSDAILGGSILTGMGIAIYKRKSFGMIALLGLGFGLGAMVINQILDIK